MPGTSALHGPRSANASEVELVKAARPIGWGHAADPWRGGQNLPEADRLPLASTGPVTDQPTTAPGPVARTDRAG